MTMHSAQPPGGRLSRLVRGIAALIVLAMVVAGVPALMVGLHLVPHSVPSLHQLGQDLKQRDNGQLAVVVIAAGVWICWLLFTLSLVPEIVAAARKRPAHPLPGLSAFQRPAGSLVAAIAIAFTIAPMIGGLTSSRADATPAPLPGTQTVATASATPAAGSHQASQPLPGGEHTTGTARQTPVHSAHPTYEVKQRDTLWGIAEDHLGDPMRYTEIVHLNAGSIGPDNEIIAGTVLVMPADATGLAPVTRGAGTSGGAGSETTHVTVKPGDTLWSIEQRVTGNGSNWQDGWEANKGRVEPGGDRFSDKDLIKPGWELDIPTGPQASTKAPAKPQEAAPRTTPSTSETLPATTAPSTTATPNGPAAPATPTQTAPAQPVPARGQQHAAASSENRYLSLEVGGGLLAATTFAALMMLRRRKFRHRRAGHVVASLPAELIPLEQALVVNGRAALAKMTFLDLALRDLADRVAAEPGAALPDIAGASINDDYLELHLAAPTAGPPEPWIATDETRWTISRDADLGEAASRRLAPYPCLVSVGYSEDGTEYLLDLEHAGALQFVGDTERCVALARHIVAELANNTWCDHLTVTVAGFGQELIGANPSRLAYTDDPHAAAADLGKVAAENRRVAADAGVDVMEGRLRGTDGDVWMPHVLLAAPGVFVDDDAMLQAAVGSGRAAVAVVLARGREGSDTMHPDARVEVTDSGRLVTSLLPSREVTACGLSVELGAEIAQAIVLEREGELDEPAPPSAGGRPWDAFTDVAGALLPEYTLPRASSGPSVVGPDSVATSSLLPGPDEVYLTAAATTQEELAVLAPAVTAETREAVENADPELDALVAAWNDPDARLAKLQVLGPVQVTAYGRPPTKPEAKVTEIVAYLWSKPNGVSTDQFANDMWPHKNYLGTDSHPKEMVSQARLWLGNEPRTGEEYIPRARRGDMQGYRVNGLLVDYDLFRRLRVRGEARGSDGLSDLVAALNLVSGTPLTDRGVGYEWLPAGEELLYQGAVAEVAHLVATRALEAGDDTQAIRACEIALQFDEADDRALLAMVKAHENAGREAEKKATILRLTTLEDPPKRTMEVMRRNGWLARGA
jgi:nucleoid-associated protein YgaU